MASFPTWHRMQKDKHVVLPEMSSCVLALTGISELSLAISQMQTVLAVSPEVVLRIQGEKAQESDPKP